MYVYAEPASEVRDSRGSEVKGWAGACSSPYRHHPDNKKDDKLLDQVFQTQQAVSETCIFMYQAPTLSLPKLSSLCILPTLDLILIAVIWCNSAAREE